MFKNHIIYTLLFILACTFAGQGQETTLFKVSDFDLNGKVKSCLVSTDYGKEEYTFNEAGFLTESVTRFNDSDYDVTLYKFQKEELLEKRVEQYRNKTLDRATSIANLYAIDTTDNRKVTEKIITYNKEFLEQNEYFYTRDGQLSKIIKTNNDGIDEISIIYYRKEDTNTADYYLNSELQQSIQTTIKMQSDTIPIKTVATKKYFEGEPSTAVKTTFNGDGKVISETELSYDPDLKKFVPSASIINTYGPSGVLENTISKIGTDSETKEYLYQFDPVGNWVKQIVTPANSYKTRKITYYETRESVKVEE